MSETELRRLVAAGRVREAVAGLHATHAAEVARFVNRRMGRDGDAADVCQEVWEAVARGLPAFRGEAPARVWVLTIARNKSLDAWRRHAGMDTLDSEVASGGPLGALLGVRRVTTPSARLERQRRSDALRRALETLQPDQREMLELRYVQGLKPAEISVVMGGARANTMAQRILRAAQRLRAALEKQEASP